MKMMLNVLGVLLILSCTEVEPSIIPLKGLDSSYLENDTETNDSIFITDEIKFPDSLTETNSLIYEDYGIVLYDTVSYTQRKQEAKSLRDKLAKAYQAEEISIVDVGIEFENFLLQKIFPHWYGTDWDFEGHTNVPNEGFVACGYFVSTTLRHMHVQLNRYHLAQQAASNGAKSLAVDQHNVTWYNEIEDFQDKLEEGLYSVGLSNHVGFLYKKKGKLFFIHSNYMDDVEVMVQSAKESLPFTSSGVFVLVRVGNAALMQKWLNQEEIFIYRQ